MTTYNNDYWEVVSKYQDGSYGEPTDCFVDESKAQKYAEGVAGVDSVHLSHFLDTACVGFWVFNPATGKWTP
jgi:hypothetical protein